MARLNYIPSFLGTVGPLTYYQMFDWYYVRSRSSLTGKRVKKDPAFRKTMQNAAVLGIGSKVASVVYAQVPKPRKKFPLFRKIVGEATTWLKYRWSREETIDYLIKKYTDVRPPAGEGACTRLRRSHCKSLPSQRLLFPVTTLRKTTASGSRSVYSVHTTVSRTASEIDSFELRAWRRRDAQFRKEYYKTFSDFAWSQNLMTRD